MCSLIWDRMEAGFQRRSSRGDTIYSRSEVLEERETRSRPYVGTVTFGTTSYNQEGRW
jgi:itaconyl-CoA hydratase